MKAAVFHGPNDVRIEDIPVPDPGPGGVLAKVDVALTCGTDRKMLLRGHPLFRPPFVFGHEFAGTITDSKVAKFKPGTRVVAVNSAPCGKCFYCGRGAESMCEHLYIRLSGAFAEYIDIPQILVEKNLLAIPDHVSSRDAALVEPLACVVRGFELSGTKPGDTVVVNGAGPIGLMFVRLASRVAGHLIVTDIIDDRLERAKKLGAHDVINVKAIADPAAAVRKIANGGRGVDVAIEAAGLPSTWESTLQMVRKSGIANLFGGCAGGTKISVDTGLIHYNEVQIRGYFHHTPAHVRQALELISEGVVTADMVVTGEYPLEKLTCIIEALVAHGGLKTAVIC